MLRALFVLLLIAVPAGASPAPTGGVSQTHPAEYMIYQYPGVSMVVKIEAAETEFSSRIYGPENALVKSSGVPSARIGPLYQLIEAVDTPRQLMIKISPGRTVERSRISMELIQLPERDRNSAAFAQAYHLLSVGMESVHANDSTTWAMKIYTIRNAARAFASLGWEEMRLWSEFYAAHLVLHKLNDVLMTLEFTRDIRAAARTAGFEMIELATLILEGEALMAAAAESSGQVANARLEQAHGVLDRIALLAGQLDLRAEQARALFNNGLAYESQQKPEQAIKRFQQALEVSLSTDDTDLVNEIRSVAAASYESQGSTSGAIEMLEDISGDLASDAGQELTDNLFEKGRIFNRNYLFPQAVAELSRALELQRANANLNSWGPTGLALAWSKFSMGEMEQAVSLILESIPRTAQSSNTQALVRAYDSLAQIYRARGQFEEVSIYREKQEELIQSDDLRIEFLFQSGLDAWLKEGAGSRRARSFLIQSGQLASATGDSLADKRAALYLCLLNSRQKGGDSCSSADIRRNHVALSNSGIPKIALDADLVKARILLAEGKERDALAVMEGLMEDMMFFRQKLPGLLGAWYWQNRAGIFEEYMAITLARSGSGAGTIVDGKQALLALDRVRVMDGHDSAGEAGLNSAGAEEESLRSLLARREVATGQDSVNLAAQASGELRQLRNRYTPAIKALDSTALEKLLSGLARDESLLTYYFSESADYAILGKRKSVSLLRLPGRDPLSGRLENLREQVSRDTSAPLAELDAMGRALLRPLSGMLTEKIFLLPSGPLHGFPFDALRLDGQFLAAGHEVANLVRLDAASKRTSQLAPGYRENVFLAGNPQMGQELFSYEMTVSSEITALTDLFVGPGLNIVQGVALRSDEFQDPRFAGASLIHLATPGSLNLAFPDRSRLLMSKTSGDSAAEFISPADIRSLEFSAGLAVLSRTAVETGSSSGFDHRLGFVSDFLDAGVGVVVASLWSGGDSETATFMRLFYSELETTQNVAEALSRTRMRQMESADDANFRSWAGFQLYIR